VTRKILIALVGLVVAVGVASPTPAFADTAVTIHGIVTMPDGSVPDVQPQIELTCGLFGGSCVAYSSTYDQATGAYTVNVATGGNYVFGFTYSGATSNVVPHIYWAGGTSQSTTNFVEAFTSGQDYPINLSFAQGTVVTGHLTGVDAALPQSGPTVHGALTNGLGISSGTFDATTQTYRIDSLAAGQYNFTFAVSAQSGSQPKYQAVTQPITVTAGQVATGPDVTLPRTASISGHVSIDNGAGPVPYSQSWVTIEHTPSTGLVVGSDIPDLDGSYEIDNVPPGTYVICVHGTQTVIESCWGGSSPSTSPTVTITTGQQVTGKDFTVVGAGNINAHLMIRDDVAAPAVNFANGRADVWKLNSAGTSYDFVANAYADSNGLVQLRPLPPGDYRVEFVDPQGIYSSEWWDNDRYFGGPNTQDIVVAAGQTIDLGDIVLLPRSFDVARTSGSDRFSGAVAMTRVIWPEPVETPGDGGVPPSGVPVIYIANGLKYPDALSAGPAAIFQGGALLLVMPTSIPSSVAAELTRLRPQKIVIVGGPASVSDDVETQLVANAAHDGYTTEISRQSGADRFEASRNLADSVWNAPGVGGASSVLIATGNNFPDALAAGPAAGRTGSPVILVNGLQPHLDQATQGLLVSLGTTDVNIVGGPSSVSPGIESDLASLMVPGHVHRYSGATRYDAAAAMNHDYFPQSEIVFAATGANFPDALAGAPLAGLYQSPIYLTQPGCLSQVVAQRMFEGDTQGIWLLGGPASLSPAVEDLTLCDN